MPQNIAKIFLNRLENHGDKKCLGWINKNKIEFLNYLDIKTIVCRLTLALSSNNLQAEEKVCILGHTSKEWHFFDLAILFSRGTVVPIYPNYLSDEIEYIINHSEAKILVVENKSQLKKIIEIQNNIPQLITIISIKNDCGKLINQLSKSIKFYTMDDFFKIGKREEINNSHSFKENINAIKGEDVATIVYTSGTTGEPKGAVITHDAFSNMLLNLKGAMGPVIRPDDRTLTFLPLSHVLGRCDSFLYLNFNMENVYAESIEQILDNIALAKPTLMISVPRIFEKIYAKITAQLNSSGPITKKLFNWANNSCSQYYNHLENDQAPSMKMIIEKNLAYKLVFSKIYQKFGGRIRFFVSGGAPISSKIIKFLKNANLPIIEGYGLTETIAPCVLNPFHKPIAGTVGVPMGDVQIKFAEDGEILIKTKAMLREYYKNKEATQRSLIDGWFYTGDIGVITGDGHIKITDRKKDIIITSGGKNIAPQKIENIMKLRPHIAHFMVIGDQRKFLTAVVSIEKPDFRSYFKELGLGNESTNDEFGRHPKVRELIQADIEDGNKELASFESIKKFIIAPDEFTVEGGQITPSLKLKKKVILDCYKNEIEDLYS
jgi:long-chain acyl-CoA synthetase